MRAAEAVAFRAQADALDIEAQGIHRELKDLFSNWTRLLLNCSIRLRAWRARRGHHGERVQFGALVQRRPGDAV